MQQVRADEVSATEWRWVIIFSGLLVLITLLPYAWAFASDAPNDGWQFMGMLYNHTDGATYLGKINQGLRGNWLFHLDYTPEETNGIAIQVFYLALGHVARLFGLSALMIFHIARLLASFVMYISIYHLGSVIWQKQRARRLFFGLVSIGAGLGWLAIVFSNSFQPSDLYIPESIPFYSSLVNPHFPLAIALIALTTAAYLRVFRPGFEERPRVSNGGVTVLLLSIALCIVQPQGWVPVGIALATYLVVIAFMDRRLPNLQISWAAMFLLPGLPIFVYYLAIANYDPAYQIWNQQNQTPSPTPLSYLVGFGLLLVVAIPGILRAVRRFERDGDRYMLIWLITTSIMLYAPFNLQRRLSIGLIIPIAFFAVRAMEDYWLNRISPPLRRVAMIALMVFIIPSNVFTMLIPLYGVMNPAKGIEQAIMLPKNTYTALQWLKANGRVGSVVLALPKPTSLWVPAYTDMRVVYGHEYETLNAADKLKQVQAWYNDGTDCQGLLQQYNVRYILIEPVEGKPESPGMACVNALNLGEPAQRFGDTSIYVYEAR
ncbi:MAG: hypothetical protein KF716_08085 [Anaerolineae bacterium]|nr:hypothetical protein [Anaerolineae bacterium]